MTQNSRKLVVVGHGAAGLAAALSAAEQARSRGLRIDITLLEKSREDEAGGNTRWSPSYMRLAAPDRLAPGFEDDMQQASGGLADHAYFRTLAEQATATIGWLQTHGVEFTIPVYYLSTGPPRIQPAGGGGAIVEKLSHAAKQAGVKFLYANIGDRGCAMVEDRVCGLDIQSGDGATTLDADAVVLACGGFQGNAAMMGAQFGPAGETIKLISPGTRFDTGDGIRMAIDQGASVSGDWNGMHMEPVDPRSKHSAPIVLVYPYGIVVDQEGRRFFDEGGGLVHETWEAFARDIHFARPKSIAYAILDSRLFDIPGYAARDPVGSAAIPGRDARRAGRADRDSRPQSGSNHRSIQYRGERRYRRVRRHPLRWPRGRRRPDAAEIELGAADHEAAVSGLSPGRRGRLYIRRSGH